MDQNIKNRIVGLVVIFALAIIFLPMLLDGSGVKRENLKVVIPAPSIISANPKFKQKIVELKLKVKSIPKLTSNFVDENSNKPIEPNKPKKNIAKAKAKLAKVKKIEQAKLDAKTKKVKKPKAKAKPKIAPKPGGDTWVLQVGSFQDRAKALSQRDKLRKSNVSAVFVEKFNLKGKIVYRVRLGPFINRDLSKVAQNKIKAKHDIDGIVLKYQR